MDYEFVNDDDLIFAGDSERGASVQKNLVVLSLKIATSDDLRAGIYRKMSLAISPDTAQKMVAEILASLQFLKEAN